MISRWCAWLLVLTATGLDAQTVPDRLTEILTERENASNLLDRQEEGCQDRFAVTDCVNAVRKRRREILAPLQREENRLRLQDRKNRDREREQKKHEKGEALGSAQLRTETLLADPQREASRIAEKMRSHHASAAERALVKSPVLRKTPANAQTEEINRDAFAKKSAALLKRQQERDQRMKLRSEPASPLPLPP